MKNYLHKPFTVDEVITYPFQMSPYKSPSPDGYSASFLQANWGAIGDKVCKSVLKFLNDGDSLTMNQNFIPLFPKDKELVKLTDYHPNSLCNVLYKIIASLSQSTHAYSAHIISTNQSVFIPSHSLLIMFWLPMRFFMP